MATKPTAGEILSNLMKNGKDISFSFTCGKVRYNAVLQYKESPTRLGLKSEDSSSNITSPNSNDGSTKGESSGSTSERESSGSTSETHEC
ncbi:hypothetical protein ACMFMG_011585 [Clarireedia jacksonii]